MRRDGMQRFSEDQGKEKVLRKLLFKHKKRRMKVGYWRFKSWRSLWTRRRQ
jgi:hypothetical protein